MENKTIRFSKGFIPAAVFSIIVIIFGVTGIFTRGINFGIDFGFTYSSRNELRVLRPEVHDQHRIMFMRVMGVGLFRHS